jgi:hypothetical protein
MVSNFGTGTAAGISSAAAEAMRPILVTNARDKGRDGFAAPQACCDYSRCNVPDAVAS